jgi:hypothetical protein
MPVLEIINDFVHLPQSERHHFPSEQDLGRTTRYFLFCFSLLYFQIILIELKGSDLSSYITKKGERLISLNYIPIPPFLIIAIVIGKLRLQLEVSGRYKIQATSTI